MATATRRRRGRPRTSNRAEPKPVGYRCSHPGCDAKQAKIKAPIVQHQNRTGHSGIVAVMKNGKTREVSANASGRTRKSTATKASSNGAIGKVEDLGVAIVERLDQLNGRIDVLTEAVEDRDNVITEFENIIRSKDDAFDDLVQGVRNALSELGMNDPMENSRLLKSAMDLHGIAMPTRPSPLPQ